MPYVRTPNNNEEAAAFALLGLAKTTGGLAVWIAWLTAVFLPWFAWPLRYPAKSIPQRARTLLSALDHLSVVVMSIACIVALSTTLGIHLMYKNKWFRDVLCEADPLAETFANNHLVGWLATALVFLVLRMLLQPVVCAICRTKGLGFFGRIGNASHIGAVWWLMIQHSPLTFLQALLVSCDLLVKHALCILWMRYKKNDLQRVCEFGSSAMLAVLSIIAVVYGGIAYSSRCDADKRHGSLIFLLHIVRCWTLLREILRFVIERKAR